MDSISVRFFSSFIFFMANRIFSWKSDTRFSNAVSLSIPDVMFSFSKVTDILFSGGFLDILFN